MCLFRKSVNKNSIKNVIQFSVWFGVVVSNQVPNMEGIVHFGPGLRPCMAWNQDSFPVHKICNVLLNIVLWMSVTGVTSVTVLYNPQFLFPTFYSTSVTSITSVTSSHQISQCNKCYKRYSLHFPVLRVLQAIQPSFF